MYISVHTLQFKDTALMISIIYWQDSCFNAYIPCIHVSGPGGEDASKLSTADTCTVPNVLQPIQNLPLRVDNFATPHSHAYPLHYICASRL